jgi:glycine/D-amino acid oxidase-like deaminating enzyme
MKGQAQVVITGGGITGCSIAYHLAQMGWTNVMLLDKGELTSGTTFHSVGLVSQFRTSQAQMLLMNYSIQLYNQFKAEIGKTLGWHQGEVCAWLPVQTNSRRCSVTSAEPKHLAWMQDHLPC